MRMTTSELVHAAYHAARYLPTASSQLMRELAERLDITQAALCESLKIRDALAAENAALKECAASHAQAIEHWNGWADAEDKIHPLPETPATDAWVNEQRAAARKEGAYFVANRMLAAWDAGFIDDTAKNAADIARMILTSTEFMTDASEGDFNRSFADSVLGEIAAQLRGSQV